jgi:methionyl-tRNA formyltransferase|tara:strand:+ start:724 stop:1608 length:885 start_codon:yes stop_codon:yes gene_type:complete
MKFVFVGQNILGGLTLKELIKDNKVPSFVVTRESDNYPNLVEEVAESHKIPVYKTSEINKEKKIIQKLSNLKPDIIFCSAWGNIIKEPLLRIPKLGWVNFHPSFLPTYKGSSPISWQLINGEEFGGCTAHFMVSKVDAGKTIVREKIKIDPDDNSFTLRKKCGKLLGKLAVKTYNVLAKDPEYEGFMPKGEKSSYHPPREKNKLIDWNDNAVNIFNLIRGLSPYPCAILSYKNKEFRVSEAAITGQKSGSGSIGSIKKDNDGKLLVGAKDLFIKIISLRISDEIVDDYADKIGD